MADFPEVLRVAYPRACNTQQKPVIDATGHATPAQQTDLKALARKVLACNTPRNTGTANTLKTAQQTMQKKGAVVAQESPPEGPVLTDRQTKAVAILKADPAQRRAFIGEPTPEGYRLAVAIRKPSGEIVVGEMVLPPESDPLRAVASCPP